MAANQQLKDYIDQQANAGVSNDAIKSALLGAGWQESDINEAMTGLAPSAGAAAVKSVEAAQSVGVKPFEIKPAGMKTKFPESQEKISPVSFATSDIFQSRNEPVFKSKGIVPQTSFPGDKPQIISATGGSGSKSDGNFSRQPIVPIVLGAVSVILLVGAGILYAQNSGLQTELNSMNQENALLNSRLDSLASDKNVLTDQITSLNQIVNDLSNQLSIFATPSGTSTVRTPISVKGILSDGGKSPYMVTTGKAIVVYVENSKDVKVGGALKPLVGSQIEISGTHMAGSDYVTVTAINGKSLESFAQPASTSTTQ